MLAGRYSKIGPPKKGPGIRGEMLLAGALTLGASLCTAETGTIARVDEADSSIAYSGTWVRDTLVPSGVGRALVSDQSGARVSINFTGTGITWIGDAGFNRGVARVYLDGTINTVDTYSDVWHSQQPL